MCHIKAEHEKVKTHALRNVEPYLLQEFISFEKQDDQIFAHTFCGHSYAVTRRLIMHLLNKHGENVILLFGAVTSQLSKHLSIIVFKL